MAWTTAKKTTDTTNIRKFDLGIPSGESLAGALTSGSVREKKGLIDKSVGTKTRSNLTQINPTSISREFHPRNVFQAFYLVRFSTKESIETGDYWLFLTRVSFCLSLELSLEFLILSWPVSW